MPLTGPGTNSFPGNGVIIIDETPIVGGTDGYVLYDNNGVVGVEAGGGGGTITEGTTPTSGFTDGYAITSSGGFVGQAQIRTILTGNLPLFVNASTGSDSYNGLSATFTGGVNGPNATLQYCWDHNAGIYDLATFSATINCAAGTYTLVAFSSWVNGTGVYLLGAGSGTTKINDGALFATDLPASIYVDGFTLYSTGVNGSAFQVSVFGGANIGTQTDDIVFDTTGDLSGQSVHLYMQGFGATTAVALHGGTFIGDGGGCIFADEFAIFFGDGDVVFSGTPNVSQTVFVGNNCFVEIDWNSVTGSVTTTFPVQIAAGGFLAGDTNVPIPQTQTTFIIFRGGGYNGAQYQTIFTPSSGDTIAAPSLYYEQFIVINPTGPLATLTIELPTAWFYGLDGFLVDISATQDIDTLNIVTTEGSHGVTTVALPTSMNAGCGIRIVFDYASKSWYPAVGGGVGISATITTAALTTLGTQGSMTFVNGVLTAQTPAT